MKKFLLTALWIGTLLIPMTYAQESDLSEFLKTSEKTLSSEFSWNNSGTISDTIDIVYPDEEERDEREDFDERYDEWYDEDKDVWDSIDISKDDVSYIVWFWLAFFWIIFGCRLIGFIFWLRMLIDAARYQKEGRVAWILVLVFFNILWAIIYLFAAKIWRKKEERLNLD